MSLKAAKAGGSAYRRTANMGDPGLGGFLKGLGKAAVGFVTGGPAGALSSVANSLSSRTTTQALQTPRTIIGGPLGIALPSFGAPASSSSGGGVKISGVRKGRADPWAGGGQLYHETTKVGGCPRGFHPNKSSYYRQVEGGVVYVPKGTLCVKNRSRNPMNSRALRRAVGRVDAAKIWQGKLAEISTAKYTASGKRKR